MTEDEVSELVKTLKVMERDGEGWSSNIIESVCDDAAKAIESLRASLANAERRAEDAEARNVFLETEIAELYAKVAKL